ncbi:MAG: hypothetical protein CMP75_00150 [Flavobacteriales bacterium]|nr:hypothetical protein [Flavobacteriales bacterium]|tara:strand:+ start:1609 stop:2250 length:642 start_codon:yes stop_codon:yes gene_type:complete
MKKFSLLLIAVFSITTAFSQNLSVNLGYGMWNGEMTHHAESSSSILIGANYNQELSEKLDLQGSLSYGIGYSILPLQSSLIYNFSEKLNLKVGMGLYMISDESYKEHATGVDGNEASTNEFGMNMGLGYSINDEILLGFDYSMIKSGDYDFNGMMFGLSYSLGKKSEKSDSDKKKKNKVKSDSDKKKKNKVKSDSEKKKKNKAKSDSEKKKKS